MASEIEDWHRAREDYEREVRKWLAISKANARRQPTVQKPTNQSTVSSSETTNTETTDGK